MVILSVPNWVARTRHRQAPPSLPSRRSQCQSAGKVPALRHQGTASLMHVAPLVHGSPLLSRVCSGTTQVATLVCLVLLRRTWSARQQHLVVSANVCVDLDGYTERNDMQSLSFARTSSVAHERQLSSLIARARGQHLMSLARQTLLATILAVPVGLSAQEAETRTVEVLGLDRAVAMAIDSNRQLKIAALDVERAQQRTAEARTKRLPTFHTYVL